MLHTKLLGIPVFYLLLLSTAIAQQSESSKEKYMLSGHLEGLPDGSVVCLTSAEEDTLNKAVAKRGDFRFIGKIPFGADYYFLKVDPMINQMNSSKALWLENAKMTLEGNVEDLKELKLTGSASHEDYLRSIEILSKVKNNDLSTVTAFIESKPGSLFMPNLVSRLISDYPIEQIKSFYEKMTPAAKKSEYGGLVEFEIALREKYPDFYANGPKDNLLPDFMVLGTNGGAGSLHDVIAKNKLTLVDVWASWCVPCRQAIPELLEVREKMKARGFEIVGLSVDVSEKAWKKAIAEDNTPWLHYSDKVIKGASRILGVWNLPAYYLIDQHGKILYVQNLVIQPGGTKPLTDKPFIGNKKLLPLVDSLLKVAESHSPNTNTAILRKNAEADIFWETRPVGFCDVPDSAGRLQSTSFFAADTGPDAAENLSSVTEERFREGRENADWNKLFEESRCRYLREWGIVFWERFPQDKRRFDWLLETVSTAPFYFTDQTTNIKATYITNSPAVVSIDKNAVERWKKYYARYREEFMQSPEVSAEMKLHFRSYELQNEQNQWRKVNSSDKFDYQSWLEKTIGYIQSIPENTLPNPAFSLASCVNTIILNKRSYGLNEDDVENIISIIEKSNLKYFSPVINMYKNSKYQLLLKTPLRFNTKSYDGKSVEIKDFKGKLVLVDFWNLGCNVCINKMPKLQQVYEKYKKYGLEIISACFVAGNSSDGTPYYTNETERIVTVHKRLTPDWPLVLLQPAAGKKYHQLWDTYAFQGVPVYFLFDENGIPIMAEGDLFHNAEEVIHNYFVKKGKIKK